MATQFLKIDLSPNARDFEQAALEPGIALLDRTGANYRTLKKWLGRLIAEPEWRGSEVLFFVADEQGARPQDIRCEAATVSDRTGVKSLKEDMEAIKKRLQEAKPDAKEAKLHQALVQHFNASVNPAGPKQAEYHFFRYQDRGTWRLVWCWGYQRKDVAPAATTICTNPACRQLFLRRQEGTRDCPACASKVVVTPPKAKRRLWPIALALLLAFAAGGLGYMAWDRYFKDNPGPKIAKEGLEATPGEWSGPMGSQLAYKVVRHSKDGEEDVTPLAVAVSENPKVARVERAGTRVRARSAGKTNVVFYIGNEKTNATVVVKPAQNPASIKLDPAEVELGVGTTARLRVLGDVEGQWVDLTEAAEWQPVAGAAVSCQGGQLEGLAEGEATVAVRYRATAEDPYRTAQATIKVVKETYNKLEIGIAPATFKEGSDALLAVTLHTADNKRRSALNSSLLDLEVDAAGIAAIEGEFLHGLRAGKGKLTGKYGDLTATADFTVESDPANRFEVWPQNLPLMVGEQAELQVSSSSTAPIRVTSSAPEIVAVETGLKVVGRAPGSAKLRVVQGAFEKEIDVEVTPANLESITFSPPRMSVPVDRSIPVRLVGQTKDGEQIDLAAEAVTWVELPQAALVELDVTKLELLGRLPTEDSPQTMVARVGDLRASGQIDVVPGPLQIELTPAGVTNLPEGQSTQLHAWAKYGGGTRTEIEPGRLEWRVQPESESSFLFDPLTATVRARKAEASLKLKAVYQGYTSNEVEIRSISQDLALTLNADREIILVGDSGAFSAAAQGSPLEHSLTGATFESSDPELLSIDKSTGDYHALAAGKVKVTVSHDKAMMPAEIEVEIVSPSDAQLAFRPDNFKLLVNGRQPLELVLTAGSREQSVPLTGGDEAVVAIPSPEAVQWQPPVLAGVKKQSPFEITAQHGGMTARALVEVVQGDGPIRVVPDKAQLSIGQALSPRVEQQVVGDQWQEIDPALIKWEGTDAVGWTPADGGLRPQLTPREASSEPLKLTADYAGKTAELVVTVDGAAPPRGPLAVVREPEGEDLPVDAQQRFTIVVDVEGEAVPAVDVKWQPAFENDYVRWDPPVLIAKRSGHEQLLSAAVGEENISFTTRTVDATLAEPELALPTEKPEEVRIVADQPQPIVLPVGTRFSSFRVEAILAEDRPEINVTREALLQVVGLADAAAPIALIGGEVVCQRLGDAEISAEFNGVKAKENLRFKVVEELELTSLAIEPSSVRLAVGERVTLHVQGFTGSQDNPLDVGDITALPKLTWKSDQTEIVAGDGPTLTGLSVGSAKVTVTDGKISATVDVEVLPADETSREDLVVTPRVLRLRVGESKWLGTDVVVRRGESDVTEQAEATSSSPDIVRVNPDLRFLEGVLPGRAVVDINVDGQTTSLEVEVAPATAIENGRIVIEPARGTLAVGESLPLRVLLVGEDGESVDRTGSAVLTSSDDQILSVAASKITGIAAGDATITATLLGAAEAQAAFSVVAEKFTALHVVPSSLRLSVGERKSLRIEAVGPAGRRQLSDHPDLSITFSGGAGVADLLGREVRGVSPGEATLQVSWQGLQASPVSVVVTDDPITGLRIEPLAARIVVGDEEAFRVYVRRGSGERLVTAADNLQISVSDTSVATVNADQSVRGLRVGTTPVTARLGSQQATAQLTVVRGGGVSRGSSLNGRRSRLPRRRGGDPANELPPGLQFIPDVLTLQLGVPGAPVRLVNVGRNGAVEDVIGQANLNVQPAEGNNVVGVQRTALGPVFLAKKVGEAQVFGRVGNRTTRDPLRVVVVDPSQPPPGSRPAHLIVQPDPLRLNVAKSGRFGRVQYVPPGGTPRDIAYTATSQDEQIVTVEKDGTLHGMAPGRALVTVRPVDSSLGDLKSDVAVFVDPPAPLSPAGTRLVLSGPRQVMLGAPAQFHVELTDGSGTQDVTSDGATLVLDLDQSSFADVQPGGIIVPKKKGQLAVRARYKDLISNVLMVTIDSTAEAFAKLEIEVDRKPLVIGERRPYRVWGYPDGDGARQDLTHLVNETSGPTVRIRGEEFAERLPSAVVGKEPGTFEVQAKLGDVLSNKVALEVVAAPLANVVLTAEPSAVTIAVGEKTPLLRVLAQAPGEAEPREVNVTWSSVSNAIAEPDPATPGVFIGKSAGRTKLEATFGGQTVSLDISVTGNVFESVALQDGSLSFLPDNHFSVSATVQYTSDIPLEYRIVTVGDSGASPWVAAPAGAAQETTLVSPPIRMGQGAPRYNLVIEARDENQRVIERFPHSFKLSTVDKR